MRNTGRVCSASPISRAGDELEGGWKSPCTHRQAPEIKPLILSQNPSQEWMQCSLHHCSAMPVSTETPLLA